MRKLLLIIIAILSFFAGHSQQQVLRFNSNGSFTVPCGVTSITVEAWGAGGDASGNTAGGGGAYAKKNIPVTPDQTYTIHVGTPSGTANTRDSYIYLSSNNHLVKAAGANGGNGGTINNSIGDIRHSGGNGGVRGGDAGGGGGSSATPTSNGANGSNGSGNNGGAGGIINGDGGNGGNGGGRTWFIFWINESGNDGHSPGGGGGQGGGSNRNRARDGNGANGRVIISYTGSSIYCNADFGNRTRPITLINFGGVNIPNSNSTDQDSHLQKCDVGEVEAGQTYPITLKGNTDDSQRRSYTDYYTVYIDWNQDGDFNDPGERFQIGTINQSNGNDNKQLTGNITVPNDAKLGITGIRVVKRYDGYVGSPCTQGSNSYQTYGQVIDFQIEVSGSCQQPENATANNQNSLTVCADAANPASITLRQTGGQLSPGQNWKWYKGTPPTGAVINTNTNGDANFDTQVAETTTFYVRAEGGDCSTNGAGKTVTVTVSQPGEIALSSASGTDQQTICGNSDNIAPIVYTISGATSASITGLPAGLSGSYNSGTKAFTISGKPTAPGNFSYTISLSGNAPCDNPTISGTITVLPKLTNVSYAPLSSYCSGGGIQPLLPQFPGGQSANIFTISSGSLPTGLALNSATGEMSGTPATAGTYHFKITASNGYCSVESAEITMNIGASGAVSQTLSPSGTYNLCSDDQGIEIKLLSSEPEVKYLLYKDGVAVSDEITGTGSAIQFTSGGGTKNRFNEGGVYTAMTADACGVQMNGSVTINVTPKPNVTFSYESNQTTFCQFEQTSGEALLNGQPVTGYFSASPGGLEFIDIYTGEIDLENSTPGTYTITYAIAAAGGCAPYTTTKDITISTSAQVFNLIGGGDYCVGEAVPDVVLDGSVSGVTYDLYKQGTPTPVDTKPGTGGPLTFSGLTPATYVMAANVGGACLTPMNGTVTITENPVPDPIYIIGGNDEVCIGTPVPLMTSSSSIAGQEQTATFPLMGINVDIPNNSNTGLPILFQVVDIPIGATITEISIYFKTGGNNARSRDLLINLKGPNGKVLNLANHQGNNNQNIYSSGTTFSSISNNPITAGTNTPKSGVYQPQATNGVVGANTVPQPNTSNVSTFNTLFDSEPLGNWYLSFKDDISGRTSNLIEATLTIKYIVQPDPVAVTWMNSPDLNDLYIDPGAEFEPYKFVHDERMTVYANASSAGDKTYTATVTNQFGCSTSDTKLVTFKDGPTLTIEPDYCSDIQNNNVVIKATSDKNVGNSWQWSYQPDGAPTNTNTTSTLKTKTAGEFYISATYNGCVTTKKMDIASELVTNGDFEQGNEAFETGYNYTTEAYSGGNTGLHPEGRYTVASNPQTYHNNFWGVDHTTADGNGKFMIVNGYPGSDVVVWRETVQVQPNTTYYFSAYAVSLNNMSPFAKLSFRVNDVVIGENTGTLPSKAQNNNSGTWERFYGDWTSGEDVTTAKIEIVNLETALGGNDFGLDDISFGTLSTFFNLTSAVPTVTQAFCEESTITTVQYEYGGKGEPPVLTWTKDGVGLTGSPAGLEPYYNGRDYLIRGIAEEPGIYEYSLKLEACENQFLTKTGTLKVVAPPDPGTFEDAINNKVIPVCYGSEPNITLADTKGVITGWEILNGNSWTPINNSAATSYQIGTPVKETVYLRAVADQDISKTNNARVSGCPAKTSDPIAIGIKNVWGGLDNTAQKISPANTSWNIPGNWSFSTTPDNDNACGYVIISDLGLNGKYPILTTETKQVPNLVLWDNSSVTISGTGKLQVSNDIIQPGTNGTGYIDAKAGTVEFNGATQQNISTGVFKDTTLKNLVISNNTGIGFTKSIGSLGIIGDITFTGAGRLTSNDGAITLKSSAEHTASLGQVPASGSASGSFVVERYINSGQSATQHGKKWQFLATPTSGQSIRDSWMEGATNITQNPHPGYGIMLSGPEGAGNWDRYSPNPSIKQFNGNTFAYDGAASADIALYNQNGWMTFIRGDRSVTEENSSDAQTTNTILRSKGALRTGNVTLTPASTSGFASFGNPYPATIDIAQVFKNNTSLANATLYIWTTDADGPFGIGLGGYVAYKLNNGDLVKSGATTDPGGSSGATNNYVFSGQAFLIGGLSEPNILFKESDKKIDAAQNLINFRPNPAGKPTNTTSSLDTRLYKNGLNIDGVSQIFNKVYDNEVDIADGLKIINPDAINLSIRNNSEVLSFDLRKPLIKSDTVFYEITNASPGKYHFYFNSRNLEMNGMTARLIDNFNKSETQFSLEAETEIPFEITSDVASAKSDRFMLVFDGNRKLNLAFKDIDAAKDGGSVNVTWNVQDQNNVSHYIVMVSNDGNNFTDLATVDANGQNKYSLPDKAPEIGYNYYKIRAVSIDGATLMSPTAEVFLGYGQPSLSVFPNPVKGGAINLVLKNQPQGKYAVRLLSSKGQTIDRITIEHAGGNLTQRIPWKNELAHGSYRLEVVKPDGKIEVIQVVY